LLLLFFVVVVVQYIATTLHCASVKYCIHLSHTLCLSLLHCTSTSIIVSTYCISFS
jgi:hypothetical protein